MKVWKVIFAALVIFSAGVVTGRLTFQLDLLTPPPPERSARNSQRSRQRPELIDRMEKELKLSPEQRERIDVILKESRERMKRLWESVSPQADEEFKRVHAQIGAELTPEQAAKNEELFKPPNSKRRRVEPDHKHPAPAPPAESTPPPVQP